MKTQKITRVILLKKKRQLLRKFCCLYEENVQWRRPFRSKLVSEGKIRSWVWVQFSDSKLLEKDLKCQTCFVKLCHGLSVLVLLDFFAELAHGFNSCNHQLFGYLCTSYHSCWQLFIYHDGLELFYLTTVSSLTYYLSLSALLCTAHFVLEYIFTHFLKFKQSNFSEKKWLAIFLK